jgi:predicted DCC family thiol-disulfide oxidoreductase YuxK
MSAQVALPVLVFDGDCGFCTTSARFLLRRVLRRGSAATTPPGEPSVEPWQHLDLAELGLTQDQCTTAVQWVETDGRVASGHEAIAAVLRAGRPLWRPLGVLLLAPGFSRLAGCLYTWISDHRYALPGGTPACRPDGSGKPG